MSLCWVFISLLLACFSALLEPKVFLGDRDASRLLKVRRPRANFFMEEIVKTGNLERECYEETCSQEEAAEIFQTKEKTMEFWYRYKNLNPCHYNPCLNGGICTNERDHYLCLCPPRYDGKNCEIEVFECQFKNGGCLHYCSNRVRTTEVECSCAEGYQLEEDGKHCHEAVTFPCGKQWSLTSARYYSRSLLDELFPLNGTEPLPPLNVSHLEEANSTHLWANHTDTEANSTYQGGNVTGLRPRLLQEEGDEGPRIIGGQLQRQGGSPWQVLIRRKDGYGFCGGTLIDQRWVVSAAHCLQDVTPDHVTIGDYDKKRRDQYEQNIRVERVVVHPFFHAYTFDSDIALLYLARPVMLGPFATPACLPNPHLAQHLVKKDNWGQVTGWGAMHYMGRSSRFLRKVVLPVVDQQTCVQSTKQVITDNMFCAGFRDASQDACTGDSGGPFVVNYRDTWFLTGVISWGEKCAVEGKYGVYTRLGNYLHWIKDIMSKQEQNSTQP